ncbi:MAG TPA: GNAT family N-acetyltransferase [Symbiobacteriaceae bacterium]
MYTVRRMLMADLFWLERAAVQAAWETLSDQERLTPPWVVGQLAVSHLRSLLMQPSTLVLVAQLGAWPVGFLVGAVVPDGSTGELNGLLINLWVAPAHRRRGVARLLRETAEALFRQMGVRKAKLWTGLHNQAAVKLAQQAGYKPEGLIGMKSL